MKDKNRQPPPSTGSEVKQFYEILPFNYHGSVQDACREIQTNPITVYPDISHLFAEGEIISVFEAGCGVGWFSNAATYHYGANALGIDLSQKAITRAREISLKLQIQDLTAFFTGDFHHFLSNEKGYDLVTGIGVLPAVPDPFKGFIHLSQLVAQKKKPFLVAMQPSLITSTKKKSLIEKKNYEKFEYRCAIKNEQVKKGYDTLRKKLSETASSALFSFTDLTTVFDAWPREHFFMDSFHFGDKGNRVIGEQLAKKIFALLNQ